ncbi:hypothetical protein [Cohaesibacter marisflavi]|uniref:hypothetical protein n=1 Tax=Cohaesibacter marisflavi TaxID=655353 RepID=UPI0029C7E9B0|nr:hypothetical protein [Cohaesibacter marisflavi]
MNRKDRLAAEKLFSMGDKSQDSELSDYELKTKKVREKNARLKALRMAQTDKKQ